MRPTAGRVDSVVLRDAVAADLVCEGLELVVIHYFHKLLVCLIHSDNFLGLEWIGSVLEFVVLYLQTTDLNRAGEINHNVFNALEDEAVFVAEHSVRLPAASHSLGDDA